MTMTFHVFEQHISPTGNCGGGWVASTTSCGTSCAATNNGSLEWSKAERLQAFTSSDFKAVHRLGVVLIKGVVVPMFFPPHKVSQPAQLAATEPVASGRTEPDAAGKASGAEGGRPDGRGASHCNGQISGTTGAEENGWRADSAASTGNLSVRWKVTHFVTGM